MASFPLELLVGLFKTLFKTLLSIKMLDISLSSFNVASCLFIS